MDGWNTTFLLGRPIFRGYVSFREAIWGAKPLILLDFRLLILSRETLRSNPKHDRSAKLPRIGWIPKFMKNDSYRLVPPTPYTTYKKKQVGRLEDVVVFTMNIALADYMLANAESDQHAAYSHRASARDRGGQDQRVLIVKPAARPTLSIAIAAIPKKTQFHGNLRGIPPKASPPRNSRPY